MRQSKSWFTSLCAGSLLALLPISVSAQVDESADLSRAKAVPSQAKVAKGRAKASKTAVKDDQHAPEINLLNAMRDGLVTVEAEGRGDGRMTMSITNNTRRQLRVVLPPGIIAQGATGQIRRHGRHGWRWHGRRHGRWHGRRHGRWHGRWHGRRHGRLAAAWVAWVAWVARPAPCPRRWA